MQVRRGIISIQKQNKKHPTLDRTRERKNTLFNTGLTNIFLPFGINDHERHLYHRKNSFQMEINEILGDFSMGEWKMKWGFGEEKHRIAMQRKYHRCQMVD